MSIIPTKKKDKSNEISVKIYQFLQNNLTVDSIIEYKQLINTIFSHYQQDFKKIGQSYQKIEEYIKEGKLTMDALTKKIVLFHGFLSSMARKNIINEQLLNKFSEELENLVEKVLLKLMEEPKKRQSSISKIYSYIREIGSSKEKKRKEEKSKMGLQDCNDKKALKQIVSKILRPFCFYLLKLLKNFKTYCQLIIGTVGNQDSPYYWKIANWCHSLGDILKELIRLGHYFSDNFLGLQLLIVYIISVDLTIFYDVLQSRIEKQGVFINLNNQDKQLQNFDKTNFIELKELITETNLVKENLNNIYCNPKLKEWKKLFSRSEYYKYEQSQGIESSSENIMKFIEKQEKLSKQNKIRDQLTSSCRGPISFSQSSRVKKVQKTSYLDIKEVLLGNQCTRVTPTSPTYKKEIQEQEQKLHLLQLLQNKRKELEVIPLSQHQKTENQGISRDVALVPIEQNEKPTLNLISKAQKISHVRKMRLMHLNHQRTPN